MKCVKLVKHISRGTDHMMSTWATLLLSTISKSGVPGSAIPVPKTNSEKPPKYVNAYFFLPIFLAQHKLFEANHHVIT